MKIVGRGDRDKVDLSVRKKLLQGGVGDKAVLLRLSPSEFGCIILPFVIKCVSEEIYFWPNIALSNNFPRSFGQRSNETGKPAEKREADGMPGAGSRAFYESRRQRREELSVMCGEGMRFPPHLHPELELFWLQSGSLYIDGREDSVILEAGDFAFFFPNDVHGYRSAGDNDRYRMAICSSPLLGDLLPTLTKHRPAQPFLRASRLHPDISYAMRRLCLDTPDGREVRRALLHLILARILEAVELVPIGEPKAMDLTTRLIEYLSLHFRQPLTLDDVAHDLGVSRYHLSRVFSQRLGSSFPDYLSFLRLSEAQELLAGTDRSVSDICLDCGFTSQRSFNRAFQKLFLTTPRQFRATRQKQPNEPDPAAKSG